MRFTRSGYMITSKKVLSSDERTQLVRLCRRAIAQGHLRDALMLLLLISLGLRASELIGLVVGDFSYSGQTLFIRALKGSCDRELPLKPGIARLLRKWLLIHFRASNLAEIDPAAPIFGITYQRLNQIWIFYRPVRKTLHSLRHSFAIDLYTRTLNVKVVQLALGHKSILSTMVYVDFYYSKAALRRYMHGRPTKTRFSDEGSQHDRSGLALIG